MKYARARYRLYFVGVVYGLLALLIVIAFRWGARFRDVAERISARRFVQALVFAPLLVLTLAILDLPLALYGQSLA